MRTSLVGFVCFCIFLLSGAAGAKDSTPKNNSADVPDIFFGPATFETLVGGINLYSTGTVKTPFLTRKVKYARTGILQKDTEFGHTWGPVTLPKGTLLYAIAFRDSWGVPGGVKATRKLELKMPEVAWCTPHIKPEHKDLVCIHARLDGSLNIVTSRSYSPYFPEYFSGHTSTKWFQEPVISEEDVDLGVDLSLEVEVRKISKKSVKIEILLSDGTKRSTMFRDKLTRDADGSVVLALWGGGLKITPIDKKTFSVLAVNPFADPISPTDEKIRPPYVIYVN